MLLLVYRRSSSSSIIVNSSSINVNLFIFFFCCWIFLLHLFLMMKLSSFRIITWIVIDVRFTQQRFYSDCIFDWRKIIQFQLDSLRVSCSLCLTYTVKMDEYEKRRGLCAVCMRSHVRFSFTACNRWPYRTINIFRFQRKHDSHTTIKSSGALPVIIFRRYISNWPTLNRFSIATFQLTDTHYHYFEACWFFATNA